MNILGISAYSRTGAACLVQDGQIIAAAQEDRATYKQNDFFFPAQSVAGCMEQAGIAADALDFIAIDAKPLLKFGRILETYLAFVPTGIGSFLREMPPWIKQKLWIRKRIVQETGFSGKVLFPEHHEVLAASAFFSSPFQKASFLTTDGAGTTSYGFGAEERLTFSGEMRFPHSLELLYLAFTSYLGLNINPGEVELMGSLPLGDPKYKKLILANLIDLQEDGSFKLDMTYFDCSIGMLVANERFAELFARSARTADSPLTETDRDIACSVLAVIEEIVFRMLEYVYGQTGLQKLCLSGRVFQSCAGRGHILRQSSFDDVWVQSESGGVRAASGSALFAWYQYLGNAK